jgi:hypothetical protein
MACQRKRRVLQEIFCCLETGSRCILVLSVATGGYAVSAERGEGRMAAGLTLAVVEGLSIKEGLMAIQVRCSCGKQVQAAGEQAGRNVRCPSCQRLLIVPGEPEEPRGYGVAQVRQCPGCNREWPLATVVCIDCGYNFETGRKMRTKYNSRGRVIDVGPSWLGKQSRAIGKDRRKLLSTFMATPPTRCKTSFPAIWLSTPFANGRGW